MLVLRLLAGCCLFWNLLIEIANQTFVSKRTVQCEYKTCEYKTSVVVLYLFAEPRRFTATFVCR